ncbi:NAD(P)/FAD-dependent oxidoreductase [Nocardioides insulae]|uniref:NAD(P)/FAD-dependent oxidoreductase n=1 Tax=Nocardioides insulae TaxID=394734 RepID=UPI000416DB4F|nr:FAD-dependent oxidoreductase [Nocardioides insulae]
MTTENGSSPSIVVVGGGLAGASAVRELREAGHDGPISLVAAEPHPPYERPPLSKGILLGTAEAESAQVLETQWYADHDVSLFTGTAVTGLDPAAGQVLLGDTHLAYDRLLLATGSVPRRLPELDAHHLPVTYLRILEESVALRGWLVGATDGHLLIVGAGWIGLEIASAARQAGIRVTVVDPADQPLLKVLGPEVAPYFAALHRSHDVDLRLGVTVQEALADGAVMLSDGDTVRPDLIAVGIGVAPDDRLARAAGLAVEDGVLVDASLRTSDPRIFAAGDVANHDHPVLGRRIRVEHWDTAIHQGRAAARAMLGQGAPYERLPYFFTDQYDMGIEYVGSVGPDGYDEVAIRGDDLVAGLSALWIKDGVIVAGMHANDWDAIDDLRALVGGPAPEGTTDPEVTLGDLASRLG